MSEVKGGRKQSHPQKPQTDNPLVTCPRCGGDGGDRYLCGLCNGQGRVNKSEAQRYRNPKRL